MSPNSIPNRIQLTQAVCVLLLLVICTGIVYANPPQLMIVALIGVLPAVAGAWFGLRYAHVGTIGLVAVSLLVPFEIGTGTGSAINATMLLLSFQLAALFLHSILFDKPLRLIQERVVYVAFAFVPVALISLIAGQIQWFPISGAGIAPQIAGTLLFIFAAAAFLLVGHQLTIKHLEWMTFLFLALGFVYMTGRAFPALTRFTSALFVPAATGSVLWVWLGALAFSQALFNSQLRPIWRIGCLVLVVLMLSVALGSARSWSSGWLPLSASLGSILLFYIARLRPRILILIMPLIVGGMLMLIVNSLQTVDQVTTFSDESYSLLTRLDAYEIVLQLAHESPLFGLGAANYYWYTPLIPIRGYFVQFNSHSQIIDLIAQTGYVGLIVYLWFFVEMWLLAWRLLPRLPQGFSKAYVLATLGGVMGMLVSSILGDWVIPFVYNVGLSGFRAAIFGWLFMGGTLAIWRVSEEGKRRSGEVAK